MSEHCVQRFLACSSYEKDKIRISWIFFFTIQLVCSVLYGDVIEPTINVALQNPGSVANPWSLFPANEQLNEYHCRIEIDYIPDGTVGGHPLTVTSQYFVMSKKKTPNSGGHTATSGGKSKSTKTMMWAIPVALVVLALFAGLGVMVYKYRRLQHSFLAFAARGNYTRQEDDLEDDDNMVVGFHAGKFLSYICYIYNRYFNFLTYFGFFLLWRV